MVQVLRAGEVDPLVAMDMLDRASRQVALAASERHGISEEEIRTFFLTRGELTCLQ